MTPHALAAWSIMDAICGGYVEPYARAPRIDEDWPRMRASLQLAMQASRIDALSDEQLAKRVRLGFKL